MKIKDYKFRMSRGVSLVEVLLYSAISAIVIGLGSGIFYLVAKSNFKNIAQLEVNNNLRFIQETIRQKIESAVAINSISEEELSLATSESSTNPTVFSLSAGVLYMKEGDGNNQPLNSFKVNVDDITFSISPPASVGISPYYHWARNPIFGYFDFGNIYGGVKVPVGAGDFYGFAYNNKIGWVSLNCVSNDQCSEINYKVSSDANGNLSGNALSLGDGLYLDTDGSQTVTVGDRRLAIGSSIATGYGFSVGSLVTSGNGDIGTSLAFVIPSSRLKSTGANGEFTYGVDGLYLDLDESNTVTVNDRRIVPGNTAGSGSGYSAGSIVATGNTDLNTTLLPVALNAQVASTNTSGNFNYSEGLISFSGVTINQNTGIFNGKANAPYIGYISFNCTTGGSNNEDICSSYNYKVADLRQKTSAIKVSLTISYKGNRPEEQITQTVGFSANLKLPSSVAVSSITPNSGQNTGLVSNISVSGSNFQNGAIVKLAKTGNPDIYPATNFSFVSSSQLSGGAFDLTGVQKGTWDVYVINPDGQTGALVGGFTVN